MKTVSPSPLQLLRWRHWQNNDDPIRGHAVALAGRWGGNLRRSYLHDDLCNIGDLGFQIFQTLGKDLSDSNKGVVTLHVTIL
jgi:hypothetical protein